MTQLNVRVDDNDINYFKQMYRGCLCRFIRNCIAIAIRDKEFFNKVFFY